MGQLLLGFRSLLVKIAVFVVMAALLAWALGGTLWPRAVVVEYEPVRVGDAAWYWSLKVGGERMRGDRSAVRADWKMMIRADGEGVPFPSEEKPTVFRQVTEPIAVGNAVAFAGQLAQSPAAGEWVLFIAQSRDAYSAHVLPDRLAVEQQLARLAAGLEVQGAAEILEQRSRVINPADNRQQNNG